MALRRHIGYHLFQTFIPSGTIVAISWINFWISSEAVPARVTICITTLLTLTTQANGARSGLPTVSYVKAIDTWMTSCLCFVVASLMEFTMVNYLHSVQKRNKKDTNKIETVPMFKASLKEKDENGLNCPKLSKPVISSEWIQRLLPSTVDRSARILFPAAFLLFNILFWAIYYPKK